ncbi:hypothetical protein KOW79_006099 [Hemibagrus wyckioides]|uniref:Uncharacterized protein n=1 Tax=Hemibagrus wyckioides TaxID=337641 RepID=A0A9D3NWS0_9TELE|nr:hypothetical protein KOW79_006099 [Hemibagrus wyckioides]
MKKLRAAATLTWMCGPLADLSSIVFSADCILDHGKPLASGHVQYDKNSGHGGKMTVKLTITCERNSLLDS